MSKLIPLVAASTGLLVFACSTPNGHSGPTSSSGAPAVTVTAGVPTLYIVGVDVSDSFQTETRIEEARHLVEGLIGRMNYGDAIAIVETFRSGTDSVGSWTDSIPPLRRPNSPSTNERHRLAQFKVRASTIAASFVHPPRPATSTDILALVQRASDYAKAAQLHGQKTTLLVVSDMMNYTPELRMTGLSSIPDENWVAARKAKGLIPNLQGVCVSVSGADVSSVRGIAVRNFWQSYFNATGANFSPERYRTLMIDPDQVACG